jgi:lipoprotein-anchoring transpeptidase ErfK/SrfK
MWTYQQSTGDLTNPGGVVIGQGYSGNGSDLDNPAGQGDIGHGPIPQGEWIIGVFADRAVVGKFSVPLMPCQGNNMDGRDGGFYIHGDNPQGDHTASDGCIVLPRPLREAIAMSHDVLLNVVA